MLAADLEAYAGAVTANGPVIFDRGLPDLIGYRRLAGLPRCAAVEAAVRDHRYSPRVFIAPPWPEIYAGDAERKQTPAEAEATHAMMAAVYPACGYTLVELPRAPVAERVTFVRAMVGA
jgi:predicted ATPase